MNFSISTNDCRVISSGIVILDDSNSDLKLKVEASDNFIFTIVLKFIESEDGNQGLEREINDTTIIFKCKNFNNALGTGTVKPLPIATVSGKKILLNFWSYLLGNSSARKVEYTFLEKE